MEEQAGRICFVTHPLTGGSLGAPQEDICHLGGHPGRPGKGYRFCGGPPDTLASARAAQEYGPTMKSGGQPAGVLKTDATWARYIKGPGSQIQRRARTARRSA